MGSLEALFFCSSALVGSEIYEKPLRFISTSGARCDDAADKSSQRSL